MSKFGAPMKNLVGVFFELSLAPSPTFGDFNWGSHQSLLFQAKEALSCIRQGRFAGAADIFERMLNEKVSYWHLKNNRSKSILSIITLVLTFQKEDPKHVYNARMARIFCLYRSSNFDKVRVSIACRESFR